MTDASVFVSVDGTQTSIELVGEVDLANHQAVEADLNEAISNRCTRVLVDLTGVTFIDSAGLRTLFRLATRLDRLQIDFELVAPTGSAAARVVELSGLSSLVPVSSDRPSTGEPGTLRSQR